MLTMENIGYLHDFLTLLFGEVSSINLSRDMDGEPPKSPVRIGLILQYFSQEIVNAISRKTRSKFFP